MDNDDACIEKIMSSFPDAWGSVVHRPASLKESTYCDLGMRFLRIWSMGRNDPDNQGNHIVWNLRVVISDFAG